MVDVDKYCILILDIVLCVLPKGNVFPELFSVSTLKMIFQGHAYGFPDFCLCLGLFLTDFYHPGVKLKMS